MGTPHKEVTTARTTTSTTATTTTTSAPSSVTTTAYEPKSIITYHSKAGYAYASPRFNLVPYDTVEPRSAVVSSFSTTSNLRPAPTPFHQLSRPSLAPFHQQIKPAFTSDRQQPEPFKQQP